MPCIRRVKIQGNSRSVQEFCYRNSKLVIIKQAGSGSTEEAVNQLVEMARAHILISCWSKETATAGDCQNVNSGERVFGVG